MRETAKVNREALIRKLKEFGIKDSMESHILGEVYFMFSLKCNLRCKVCAWWGKKGTCRNNEFLKKYSSRLSLKDFKRFADELFHFRPKTVTFSGGEPLLYKKWYAVAKYFKKKGIKVSLTTNGVLLLENFEKVVEVIDEINLSLGGSPSVLPLIREDPPSHFELILKGLKKLTSFKQKNENKPNVRILYTISDLSYDCMEELINFMENESIKIDHYHFQHLMFIDPKTFELQKKVFMKEFNVESFDLWKGYTYFPSNLNFTKFKHEIKKVKKFKNVSFSPNLYLDEIEEYYQNKRGSFHYVTYCTAPWHQIDVMPNGDIYTCHDYFIGNIKDASFNDIWNGQKARELRSYLMRRLFPGCTGCFYYYCERRN